MSVRDEPHPDTPVFITTAGAEAQKVPPLVEALTEIGKLAASSSFDPMETPVTLGRIMATAILALRAVGEFQRDDEIVRAMRPAVRAALVEADKGQDVAL